MLWVIYEELLGEVLVRTYLGISEMKKVALAKSGGGETPLVSKRLPK